MFPVADAIRTKVPDGKEAEWKVKGGKGKVYTKCRPAVFTRQFAQPLREREVGVARTGMGRLKATRGSGGVWKLCSRAQWRGRKAERRIKVLHGSGAEC